MNVTRPLPNLSETAPLPKNDGEKNTSKSYIEYEDSKDKDLTRIINQSSDNIESLDETRFAAGLMSRPGLMSTKIKFEWWYL